MHNISDSRFPVCSICDKPVKLETSKADELGKPFTRDAICSGSV
jgi:hypothetical protein